MRVLLPIGLFAAVVAILALLDVSAMWLAVVSGVVLGVFLPVAARRRRAG